MRGEKWNGTHCVKCSIGHYKNVTGNLVPCYLCPDGELAPGEGYSVCGEIHCLDEKHGKSFLVSGMIEVSESFLRSRNSAGELTF